MVARLFLAITAAFFLFLLYPLSCYAMRAFFGGGLYPHFSVYKSNGSLKNSSTFLLVKWQYSIRQVC